MAASLLRFETARANFCVQEEFKTALYFAVRENRDGSYKEDMVDRFITGYETGEIDRSGRSSFTIELFRSEAINEFVNALLYPKDPEMAAKYGLKIDAIRETPLEDLGKIVDRNPELSFKFEIMRQVKYEELILRRRMKQHAEAALGDFELDGKLKFAQECTLDVKLLRKPVETMCADVAKMTELVNYIETDHRSTTEDWFLGRKKLRRPGVSDICHSLAVDGEDRAFAADINEIMSIAERAPWGVRTIPYVLGKDIDGKSDPQLKTWGTETRIGNFKLEIRLVPYPVFVRDLDRQTISAIRSLNSGLDIFLEKDGVILMAGIVITANAVDWLWQDRPTVLAIAGPNGSLTPIHQLTSGQGEKVFTLPVNSPSKQILDGLQKGQTLVVALPPSEGNPFIAMPFSNERQAEAIQGFLRYMRKDAEELLDARHFQKMVAELNKE